MQPPKDAILELADRLTPESMQRAGAEVLAARRIVVASHWRPDGDAVGCVVALREVLRGLGKSVLAGLPDAVPGRYSFLEDPEPIPNLAQDPQALPGASPDLLLIVDTAAWGQIAPIAAAVQALPARRLIVDHHVTRDIPAAATLYDPSAGATGLVLLDWFEACGWTINRTAAEALFVAIATDTGWFRFSNADARMYRAAARLIDQHAVVPADLYQRLYLSDPPERVRLLASMLGTLELHAGGQLAVCCITREMFARAGAEYWQTEDLINEPQRIGRVRVAALLIEEPDGKVRISLRSKDALDVAAIAQRFGGGGHEHAAGARVAEPLDAVKAQVVEAVGRELDLPDPDGQRRNQRGRG